MNSLAFTRKPNLKSVSVNRVIQLYHMTQREEIRRRDVSNALGKRITKPLKFAQSALRQYAMTTYNTFVMIVGFE